MSDKTEKCFSWQNFCPCNKQILRLMGMGWGWESGALKLNILDQNVVTLAITVGGLARGLEVHPAKKGNG
jgi:hypothetical protein